MTTAGLWLSDCHFARALGVGRRRIAPLAVERRYGQPTQEGIGAGESSWGCTAHLSSARRAGSRALEELRYRLYADGGVCRGDGRSRLFVGACCQRDLYRSKFGKFVGLMR